MEGIGTFDPVIIVFLLLLLRSSWDSSLGFCFITFACPSFLSSPARGSVIPMFLIGFGRGVVGGFWLSGGGGGLAVGMFIGIICYWD